MQNDINLWYTDLLKLKQEKQAVPGLPDAIARLARDFWVKANEAASDALADERANLADEKREMEKLIDLAQEDTVQAVEIANALKGKLAVATETIAGRDETIKRLEESLSEIRATVQSKDERIEGLTADPSRKAEEHAASLVELDGMRKHALLQIDSARGESRHWKAEFERVDAENKSTVQTYRQRAVQLGLVHPVNNGRERLVADLSEHGLVAFDDQGRPSFETLQQLAGQASRRRRASVVLFCFDLLHIAGVNTRGQSYSERRRMLEQAVKESEHLRLVHSEPNGHALFDAAAAMDMEGLVAKRRVCSLECQYLEPIR